MSNAPDSVVRAVAAHEPRCSNVGGGGHTGTNEPPIYCHPCSEAAQEWVTWTPEHVADAAWAAAYPEALRDAGERVDRGIPHHGMNVHSAYASDLRRWADESDAAK